MEGEGDDQVIYGTMNDMVRELDIDRNHWINIEAMKFLKKSTYDRCKVKIRHVPEDLDKLRFQCEKGHSFKLNWLAKTWPVTIFKLKEGLLQPANRQVECTVCGHPYNLPIDTKKFCAEKDIFGDEAFRIVDGKTITTYAFVSFMGGKKSATRFGKEFSKIKKYLVPTQEPESWVLHVLELLSPEKRAKNPLLSHLNRDQAQKGVRDVIKLVCKYAATRELLVYSAAGVVYGEPKGADKIENQSRVYNSALMRVVSAFTKSGVAPKFYFERTGADGWAKNLFEGGRLTLLWMKLTHGIPVRSPEFVEPSYSLFLQVADVVSYVVARHLFCIGSRAEGKPSQPIFSTSELGKVSYIWTDGNGHWNEDYSVGFPSKKMFKGGGWEPFL